MKKHTYYMIQDGKGDFSSGGLKPFFSTKGKVWTSLGGLKNHLRQFQPVPRKYGFSNDEYNENYESHEIKNPIPKDWVVVELGVVKEVCQACKLISYPS